MEFGPEAVERSRKSISMALIHEINARRERSNNSFVEHLELKHELRKSITLHSSARFDTLCRLAQMAKTVEVVTPANVSPPPLTQLLRPLACKPCGLLCPGR